MNLKDHIKKVRSGLKLLNEKEEYLESFEEILSKLPKEKVIKSKETKTGNLNEDGKCESCNSFRINCGYYPTGCDCHTWNH